MCSLHSRVPLNMDVYPTEYVEHNLPLILLSGLGKPQHNASPETGPARQESGSRIQCSSPECSGERARLLLRHLIELDGTNRPWNSSTLPGPTGSMRYQMKPIGRVGMRGLRSLTVYIPFVPANRLSSRHTLSLQGRLRHCPNRLRLKALQINQLKWNCIRHFHPCLLGRPSSPMDYLRRYGSANTNRISQLCYSPSFTSHQPTHTLLMSS